MSEGSGVWTASAVRAPRGGVRGESLGGSPRMHRLGNAEGNKGRAANPQGTPGVTGVQFTGGTGEHAFQRVGCAPNPVPSLGEGCSWHLGR